MNIQNGLKFLLPLVLGSFLNLNAQQSVLSSFNGYADIVNVVQDPNATGADSVFTLQINNFAGSPRFQPFGPWIAADVQVGCVVWVDCSRLVIKEVIYASYSSMEVKVTVPQPDWLLGVSVPLINTRCAVVYEDQYLLTALPAPADGNAGALSGINNSLFACMLNHYSQALLTTKNSVNEITDYVAGLDTVPSESPIPNLGETWRNSVGQLFYSNGTQWLTDKEVLFTNYGLEGLPSNLYKLGLDTLGQDTLYVSNNGIFNRFQAGLVYKEGFGINIYATDSIEVDTNQIATQYDLSQIEIEIDTFRVSGGNVQLSLKNDNAPAKTIPVTNIAPTQTIVAGTGISVSSAPNVTVTNTGDLSNTNEIQSLSTNGTAGNISISSGNTITLNVNDADASTTNEIQQVDTFRVNSPNLELSLTSDGQSVRTVPLSSIVTSGGGLTGNGVAGYLPQYNTTSTLDTSGVFWNATTGRLGIRTNIPSATLSVSGRIDQLNTGESIFIGLNAGLVDDLTANRNVFIGDLAGRNNTSGSANVSIGYSAGFSNTTGSNNFNLGSGSGNANTTGSSNVNIGTTAGRDNIGGNNIVNIGNAAGRDNISGSNNTIVGASAARSAKGSSNLIMGYLASFVLNNGSNNVVLGDNAGRLTAGGASDTTMNNSIIIGQDARGLATSQTNQVVIGYNGRGLGSNTTVLGNSSTTQTWLGGSLTLGTQITPLARLHVAGASALNTDRAVLITNNATTPLNLFEVRNAGEIYFNQYPNTLNTSGNPVNVLSTGADGVLQSHPISEVISSGGGIFGSGTATQVTYFSGTNTITSEDGIVYNATNNVLGINMGGISPTGANLIIKNSQEPLRTTVVATQGFASDTINWTRGAGWTFNGTQAVATLSSGVLTYTPALTITNGNWYEVTYTMSGYSTGTLTVNIGNSNVALPSFNVTNNVVVLKPTAATGGFRFTTSSFTGIIDNITVVQISNPAPVLFAGQDDNSTTLYSQIVSPNSQSISIMGGGLYMTGVNNISIGSNALRDVTSGARNIALGGTAGQNITSGVSNVAIGNDALSRNTIGSSNVAIGGGALFSNINATGNTAVGEQSMEFNTIGSSNAAFGRLAMQNNTTGNNNSAFGSTSMRNNTTGSNNSAIGISALLNNRTGSNNMAMGFGALNQTTGSSNSGIGSNSLSNLRNGSFNTAIGSGAGNNTVTADSLTGSYNTIIGADAATNIAGAASNNLVIGNQVNLPVNNGNNQINIKNIIFGIGASGTGTTIAGNIGIGNTNPQARLQISGASALNTGTAVLVTDNATTPVNLFEVRNGGDIYLNRYPNTRNDTGTPSNILSTDASGLVLSNPISEVITSGGGILGSGSTNRLAIWNSSTNLGFESTFIVDSTNSELGLGISPSATFDVLGNVEFQNPSTSFDGGVIGSELLTTGTGAGWTGTSFATGYKHDSLTTNLVSGFVPTIGSIYQVLYTVSGRTTGSFTFSFGGYTSGTINTNVTNVNVSQTATTTGVLTIVPTVDFNGTVVFFIKRITNGSAGFVGRNQAGSVVYEERYPSSSTNIFQGNGAGRYNTTGLYNVFQGAAAGATNTTGSYNVFQGDGAGLFNTTGNNNLFQGARAGYNNTTGEFNLFQGAFSGVSNLTGSRNIFQGFNAGYYNTSGTYNIFQGYETGFFNTTGGFNTFVGYTAGQRNTTGNSNVFQGANAGQRNTTGSNNVAIGLDAARYFGSGTDQNTIFNNSIFLGFQTRALGDNQTNQIVIGYNVVGLGSNTTRIGNTSTLQTHLDGELTIGNTFYDNRVAARIVGANVLSTEYSLVVTNSNGATSTNTNGSLVVTNDGKVGVGTYSPTAPLSVSGRIDQQNTGESIWIGQGAGRVDDLSTNRNVFLGFQAGFSNTTGENNVFEGYQAGYSSTTGTENLFQGFQAGFFNTTGSTNIFQGYRAGYSNTTGSANFVQGNNAGYNLTTGNNNLFQGASAGRNTTTGIRNNFQGIASAFSNVRGSNNIAIGYEAARYIGTGTTGNTRLDSSIFIGYQTRALDTAQINQIVIGYNVVGLGSNTTRIGNSNTTQTHLDGKLSLGSTATPVRTLNVTGEARITDLTTDTPTRIVGADADGDLGEISLGSGLSITSGVLNTSSTLNTGSGTAGQVTFWNGTNSITGDADLIYDATSNLLTSSGTISGNVGEVKTGGIYRTGVCLNPDYTPLAITTGAIEITLPSIFGGGGTARAFNMQFDVIITPASNNVEQTVFTVYVAGNNTPTINNESRNYVVYSSKTNRTINYRIGHDGTNIKIWIGDLTTSWGTGIINISNVVFSRETDALVTDICQGWSITSEATAFNTVVYSGLSQPFFNPLAKSSVSALSISGNQISSYFGNTTGLIEYTINKTSLMAGTYNFMMHGAMTNSSVSPPIPFVLKFTLNFDNLTFSNASVVYPDGRPNNARFTFRFGNDGTNMKIWIGESVSQSWSGGHIFMINDIYSYQNNINTASVFSILSNSSISLETVSTDVVNQTVSPNSFNNIPFSSTEGFSYSNNLTWDATNSRLGLASTSPAARLHVVGADESTSNWTAQFHNSTGTNNALMIRNDGNVGIGTSSPTSRLHVGGAGSTRLEGSVRYGSSADGPQLFTYTTANGTPVTSGTNLAFYNYTGALAASQGAFSFNGDAFRQTTGINQFWTISHNFNPTSGNATYSTFYLNPRVNQTGTAAGITQGLLISPTITNATDFRAFEISALSTGYSMYISATAPNYLAGNLSIGTTTASRTLHVAGEVRITDLSTDNPTRLVGADADGDLDDVVLGEGLTLSSGVLDISSSAAVLASEVVIEGSTATTIDLDVSGNVKTIDGGNATFVYPSNLARLSVYKNGVRLTRTGSLTTRDFTVNTTTNEITFSTPLISTDRIVIVKL